jgi:hypothetical protein
MAEGKDKAALLAASLPPPDKLGKGDSGGGPAPAGFEASTQGLDSAGETAALADFDAAAPGSPERTSAFKDAVYMCVMAMKERGEI